MSARARPFATATLLVAALAIAGLVAPPAGRLGAQPPVPEQPPVVETTPPPDAPAEAPSAEGPPPTEAPGIRWRRSRALGSPAAGRLISGVRLPAEGRHFISWDPVLRQGPNRPWRRFGTDTLVRRLLRVARSYARAHPGAPRIAIGDLSRPRGGDFGRRFGPIGHASHQNGLDVDVYYPRRDGAERGVRTAGEVDRRLAQDLVNRFVAAGAQFVFVGPSLGLRGPRGVVQAIPHHDNHLHLRIRRSR